MAETSTSPKRGRPRTFDRDEVLTAAIGAFWQHGVDATTLVDLEQAAGVVRTTIYNSFGGRDGLYRDAARLYVERTKDSLFGSMLGDAADVDDVVAFLDRLAGSIRGEETPTGCLIVNDLTSPAIDRAAARDYLDSLRGGVEGALRRTSHSGRLAPEHVSELTDLVVTGVIGANLLCRAVGRDAAINALESLRTSVSRAVDA